MPQYEKVLTELTASTVILPTDLQSQYRPLLDSYSGTGLAASGTDAGTAVDVSDYTQLTIIATMATTAHEIIVEQSGDGGTNWDYKKTITRVAGDTSPIEVVPILGDRVKVSIKNTDGVTASGAYRVFVFGRVI